MCRLMTQIDWKYKVGDVVTLKSDGFARMTIVERRYTESEHGYELVYTGRPASMGQMTKEFITFMEIELERTPQPTELPPTP